MSERQQRSVGPVVYTIDGTSLLLKVLGGKKRVHLQKLIVMIHSFTLNCGWLHYLLNVLTSSDLYSHVWSFFAPCYKLFYRATCMIGLIFYYFCGFYLHHKVMEIFSLWVHDDELIFIWNTCFILYTLELLKVQFHLFCMFLCCLICTWFEYRVQIHLYVH